MKRVLLAASVAAVSLVAAGLAAPSALAAFPDSHCEAGTLPSAGDPGPWHNVTVDKGMSCFISSGATIFGDLKVSEDAEMGASGVTIFGQLNAKKAVLIRVFSTSGSVNRIGGVKVTESKFGENELCGIEVGRDVVVQNSAHSAIWGIGTGSSFCPSSGLGLTIGGNLTVQGNRGKVDIRGNTAHGNITVQKNTETVLLFSNHAPEGTCKASDNPAFTGFANTDKNGLNNTCNS